MSYGMEILTTQGLVDIANVRCVRIISINRVIKSSGTTSGSVYVPTWSSTGGFYYTEINDANQPPRSTWNEAAKTLTWNDDVGLYNKSQDFQFVFARFT
jgi:hypothetical protein